MEASNSNTENPTDPHPDSQIIRTPCRRPTMLYPQISEDILNSQSIDLDEGYIQDNSDIRVRFENTGEFPYSVHGVFFFDLNNIRYFGTGIMIGLATVLTAGHNLYDRKTKAYAKLEKMQFVPGMNGLQLPFRPVKVEKYFVSTKYVKEGKEDYGILILEEPIGVETGYFHLSHLDEDDLKSKIINVFGYPSDKVYSKPKNYELWGGWLQISRIGEGFIYYLINTAPGQSGSGVFYREGDHFYVCGIHVHGDVMINRGTLLTKVIREQIDAWQRDFDESKKKSRPKQGLLDCQIDPEADFS